MNDDLGIDRLVIAVRDLKMAIVAYQAYGFDVVHGDRHDGSGVWCFYSE
jgi:hypothetical protein